MMSVAYQGYKNGFWNIYYENFLNHLLDSIQIGGYNLKNPLVFCYDIPLSDYNPLTPYFVVFEKDSLLESESDIFLNTFGFILADSLIRISHNPGKNSEPEVAYLWESDTTKLAIIWINDNNGKKDLWIAKSVFIPYITSIKKNEKQFNFISIKQNYPNPFNPKTTIEYYLTRSAKTSITVYNVLGEIIKVFDEGFQTAGTHEITFNGENYPSGIYYYNIKSGSFSKTKSMVLLK